MRIVINAIWANRQPCDGHTNYSYHIVGHILSSCPQASFLLFYYGQPIFDSLQPGRNVSAFSFEAEHNGANLLKCAMPFVREKWNLFWPLRKFRPDVLFQVGHSPDLVCYPCKKVFVVYDLSFLIPEFRESFPATMLKDLVITTQRNVRGAAHLIAISENTKRDVVQYYQFPEDRITVIPPGIDAKIFHPQKNEASTVRERYGIQAPYLVSIGVLQPRKNLGRLLEAFALLKHRDGLPHSLVLIGGKGWGYEDILRLPEKLNIKEHVFFTDYIPVNDLAELLRGADVFVFPPLYEGFGIPVLEAMACGVPVAGSDTGSVPEAVGDGGVLFNPYSVEDMAEKILRLARDKEFRNKLACKGLNRVKNLSWENAAWQTLKVLESVCSSSHV